MRIRPLGSLNPWLLGVVALAACSPKSNGTDFDDPFGEADGGESGQGDSGGHGGSSGGDGGFVDPGFEGCEGLEGCGDEAVCVKGACCPIESVCGDVCCGKGAVCSFQKCETPGEKCTDSDDCGKERYCEYSLGEAKAPDVDAGACVGGAVVLEGRCLPRPKECAPDAEPEEGPLTCLQKCEYRPPVAELSPVLKYAWGGATAAPWSSDVMMTPIVIQLDDDDCDGQITARDIPEIVFSTFENGNYKNAPGVLRAISIVEGEVVEKWAIPDIVNPTKHLAGGNIDGVPGNEVVACGTDGKVYAFNADGSVLWATASAIDCFMPQLADLDGDGHVEVIVEGGILDGASGALKAPFSEKLSGSFVVSDIDGDGNLDIVTATQGFRGDGTLFVDTAHVAIGVYEYANSDWKGPWAAVADLDGDGKPEIVAVDNFNHALSIWRYDASKAGSFEIVRAPVDMNAKFETNHCKGGSYGATHGGGPPTIADFDGDGTPDIALAGGIGYVVFDGKRLMDATIEGSEAILWAKETIDCSSASTGSTVFDFDGDGRAEVVYSDEKVLRIYEGATGKVLFETCNTTATLIENPIVADVDNDGQADIIVVSNAYGGRKCDALPGEEAVIGPSGVRVFSDARHAWVRTRRVWNQHSYHVTNIEEDGTIPKHEASNWKQPGLNNFRQNKQPGYEFAAPDATVSVAPRCQGDYAIVATVRNLGQALLPSGTEVRLYAGTEELGQLATSRALYPAEAEALVFEMPNPDPKIVSGARRVHAVVAEPLPTHECRTDNNVSEEVEARCKGPI